MHNFGQGGIFVKCDIQQGLQTKYEYIYSAFFIAMTNKLLELGCEVLLQFIYTSMVYLTTLSITHTK
jgi:hypothetical protein